jgi:hypothetical protein
MIFIFLNIYKENQPTILILNEIILFYILYLVHSILSQIESIQ